MKLNETVTIRPHHPDCRGADHRGIYAAAGLDPERCCYCAALIRHDLGEADDPLDYRYGGPGCQCD